MALETAGLVLGAASTPREGVALSGQSAGPCSSAVFASLLTRSTAEAIVSADDHAVRRPSRRAQLAPRRLRAGRFGGRLARSRHRHRRTGRGQEPARCGCRLRASPSGPGSSRRCSPAYGDGITVSARPGPRPRRVGHRAPARPRPDSPRQARTTVVRTRSRRPRSAVGSPRSSGSPTSRSRARRSRWAIRRFFEALAAEGPLVLLVDDLQWAEPALIDLLEHVLDLGRGPILLVAVARPELEETAPGLACSIRAILLVRLELAGRDRTAADAARPSRAGTVARAAAFPDPCRGRGQPAVRRAVRRIRVATRRDAGWARGLDDQTVGDLPIPPTIGALLAARLDRLPDIERRLLERAAVVGRTFWAGALADLLPDDERADLPRRLARLARRDLIRPERSDFPDDEAYRFRHLLIRDAAYAALPKSERAEPP